MKLIDVPLSDIIIPATVFRYGMNQEKFEELKESIRQRGLLFPLIVAERSDQYELVCGYRRRQALEELGWDKVPCFVFEGSDEEKDLLRFDENLAREELSPVEEAELLKLLIEKYGFTQEELAKRLGISQSTLSKKLALCKYPNYVRQAIHEHQLGVGIAQILMRIDDPVERDRLMQHAIQGGATQQLALDWVEAYEKEKRLRRVIAERGELPSREEVEEEEEEPIKYPDCFLCGESGKYLRLTSQYICVKCIDELNQKMEEARHASDQES